jgi:hypothetical protein
MLAGVIPLKRTNSFAKLPGSRKLPARLEKDETISILAPLSLSHRMVPIVIQEISIDCDDQALSLDCFIYDSSVFFTGYAEVPSRVDVVLWTENVPVSGEVIYRGIVFRTPGDYASAPAAVFGSCLLFAYACPVLSFPAAIILGTVSAVLYNTTRNLAASIIANATLTFAGGALTLYHALLHR